MKIVVADKISPRGVQLLSDTGWNVSQPAPADLAREIADADALIVRSATRVTEDLLSHAPKLRIVGRAGVGVDNIEMDAATRRGVLVVNTPGGNAASVAEHALALNPYLTPERAAEWGVELLLLAEMLAQADYLSLHTALSPATDKMVNAALIAQMKRGARLINTARGELVDEAALADALRSGHLAGAALDVFAVEPPRDSPLLAMSNVIATPHVAGSTAEAQEEVGVQIAQQVRDYLAEGVLRNAVNLPAVSPEQYRRLRPYLELAERVASLAAQAATFPVGRVRIACVGEPAELGAHILRSAALAGVLNAVLSEHVNLVNAPARAAERGLVIEETTRPRERGIADVLEITVAPAGSGKRDEVSAEGTVLYGTTPRLLRLNGIDVESPLEGTLLLLRNRDVPGVVGQVGTLLGREGVNIATFAMGRREAVLGAEALAIIGLDGEIAESILPLLRTIPNVLEARLIRLPRSQSLASSA